MEIGQPSEVLYTLNPNPNPTGTIESSPKQPREKFDMQITDKGITERQFFSPTTKNIIEEISAANASSGGNATQLLGIKRGLIFDPALATQETTTNMLEPQLPSAIQNEPTSPTESKTDIRKKKKNKDD